MAVEYATTLEVLDAESRSPAALPNVVRRVLEWAEIPRHDLADYEGPARSGSAAVTRHLDAGDGVQGWTLALEVTSEDRSGDLVDWMAKVTVVESRQTIASIRVERTAQGNVVRPLATRPKPPQLVTALVDRDDLDLVDGPVPICAAPRYLTEQLVESFVARLLLSPARRLPVVAVSEAHGTSTAVVNPNRLAADLVGLAHVWLVPSDVSWHLSERLSRRLSVYNGATRIWWPGLSVTDSPNDHPLWLRRAGGTIEHDIVDLLTSVAASRFGEPPEIRSLEARLRRRDDESLRAEFEALMELATAPPDEAARRDEIEESVRGRLESIEQDRNNALDEIERLEAELDALRRDVASLESENHGLRARSGYWERDGATNEPELSEEKVFLQEVVESYETRFTEADRETHPLLSLSVGPHFLATLEQIDISRSKVVDVCAEIACRRVHQIKGRDTHSIRKSQAANAPALKRSTDGATAWRCCLEKSSRAARLHWWAHGNSVEFASVGHHDFMEIPE